VTHFASPGVPLDAPGDCCHRNKSQAHNHLLSYLHKTETKLKDKVFLFSRPLTKSLISVLFQSYFSFVSLCFSFISVVWTIFVGFGRFPSCFHSRLPVTWLGSFYYEQTVC